MSGPDRVLCGSDTPFHHPSGELAKVRVSGLPADLTDRVLGENGRALFLGEHASRSSRDGVGQGMSRG